MKRTYLIDGYNLLHAMGVVQGKLGPHGLEKARMKLLGLLAESFGTDAPLLTVVFDSSRAPPKILSEQKIRGIRVYFAWKGQEADDLIEDLLAHTATPKQVVVVSDDHRLQKAARRRHSQPMKCAAFLDVLDRHRQKIHPSSPAVEKSDHLNPEETHHWLEEFRDLQKYLDKLDPY